MPIALSLGYPILANLCLTLWAGSAVQSQSTVRGTVLSLGATRIPIAGAHVEAAQLGLAVVTDTSGRFLLVGIPAGEHKLIVRAAGHHADSFFVAFADNESVSKDFVLRPRVTRLSEVQVSVQEDRSLPVKLVGFEERRRLGIGRQLDRAAIARFENRRTSELIATIPGAIVKRGNSSKAWAASSRAVSPSGCAMCGNPVGLDRADIAAGARPACYMDVYLDGALIYDSTAQGVPLFDLNSISVSHIEAIEVYASAAQIPAQYNRTARGCGVLLIWTR